jgi:hypothetical protein
MLEQVAMIFSDDIVLVVENGLRSDVSATVREPEKQYPP